MKQQQKRLSFERSSGRPKPKKTEGSAEDFGRRLRPKPPSVFLRSSAEDFEDFCQQKFRFLKNFRKKIIQNFSKAKKNLFSKRG